MIIRYARRSPFTFALLLTLLGCYAALVAQAGWRNLDHPLADTDSFGWQLVLYAAPLSAGHEWWRILTPALVHLGIGHLVLNLFALAVLGGELERIYGNRVVFALSLGSVMAGSLACLWFAPEYAMGGASTIVFGWLAALVALKIQLREQIITALTLVAVYFGWSWLSPDVSVWGHIGGFAGGALTMLVLRAVGVMTRPLGAISNPSSSVDPR